MRSDQRVRALIRPCHTRSTRSKHDADKAASKMKAEVTSSRRSQPSSTHGANIMALRIACDISGRPHSMRCLRATAQYMTFKGDRGASLLASVPRRRRGSATASSMRMPLLARGPRCWRPSTERQFALRHCPKYHENAHFHKTRIQCWRLDPTP